MICSDEPDDACVDEADLRGRRALDEDGVAMMAVLGDQPRAWPLSQFVARDAATSEDGDRGWA